MFKLITLAGLAAGAVYFFDKEKGEERREQLRAKLEPMLVKLDETTARDAQDPSSPVSGIIRGARSLLGRNEQIQY